MILEKNVETLVSLKISIHGKINKIMVNYDASITKYDNKEFVACVKEMIRIRGRVSISFNKLL